MTWPVVGAFLVTFVAGPLLCAGLLRLPSTLRVLAGLAMAVVVGMGAALWLEPRAPLPSRLRRWAGWVTAVAMVGHALYRRLEGRRARRWITVIAILATTLPWFGLATARLMA